ncbi:STAS/SEC14 domain-containing protein [bacterium]|nr:STAS/SEC14 domain-containing protein [bacterium]
MSFNVTETAVGNVIEVQLSGKLTKEAYHEFVPFTEEKIKEHGKIRLLVVLHDFHGWDAGAMWEDIKFDLHHFRDIERLAIVGESRWEKGMASFCRPFTTANVKYFEKEQLDEARQWITSEG